MSGAAPICDPEGGGVRWCNRGGEDFWSSGDCLGSAAGDIGLYGPAGYVGLGGVVCTGSGEGFTGPGVTAGEVKSIGRSASRWCSGDVCRYTHHNGLEKCGTVGALLYNGKGNDGLNVVGPKSANVCLNGVFPNS